MSRRAFARAGAATVGAATAVAALLVSTSTGHAASTTSYAWGTKATGYIPYGPTPYVESTDGKTVTKNMFKYDGLFFDFTARDIMAGNNKAHSINHNITVGEGMGGDFPMPTPELKSFCADPSQGDLPAPITFPQPFGQVDSFQGVPLWERQSMCDLATGAAEPEALWYVQYIKVQCQGDTGSTTMKNTKFFFGDGKPMPTSPEPNMTYDGFFFDITLNKQTKNPDGSFTVEGIVIEFMDDSQTLTFGNATCGAPNEDDDDGSGGGGGGTGPTATRPAPVTTGLPVAG